MHACIYYSDVLPKFIIVLWNTERGLKFYFDSVLWMGEGVVSPRHFWEIYNEIVYYECILKNELMHIFTAKN